MHTQDADVAVPLCLLAACWVSYYFAFVDPIHPIRQGQKILSFYRDGEKTEMVSPTEGEVMAMNPEVAANPALLRSDPYGKGWLLTINVPDEENTTRNLIPKGLVHDWMRLAVDRLYSHQPMLAGAAAADGGRPAEDLLAEVPGSNWKQTTAEFFLTV